MLRASSRFSIREWSRMQAQANLMSTSSSFYSAWSFRSVLEVKLAKLKFLNKNAHWITVAMLSKGKPFWMLGKLMTVPLFVKAESLWLVYRSKNAKTACWLKHVWSYVESPFLWRSCLFKQCNDKIHFTCIIKAADNSKYDTVSRFWSFKMFSVCGF